MGWQYGPSLPTRRGLGLGEWLGGGEGGGGVGREGPEGAAERA